MAFEWWEDGVGETNQPAAGGEAGTPADADPVLAAPLRLPMEAVDPLLRRSARVRPRWRLVCLPHAGAGAGTFSAWSRLLPLDAELFAVQLAGRGDRVLEEPKDDLQMLIDQLCASLRDYVDLPYMLFGHCGGALLAFELGRALAARHAAPPRLLVVSGQAAPDTQAPAPMHDLPDDRFLARLRALGGLPPLLDHPELLELLMPALRADMRLAETYRFTGAPLVSPVLAVAGTADCRVDTAGLNSWTRFTTGHVDVRRIDGDHLYFEQNPAPLLEAMVSTMSACSATRPDLASG